MLGIIDLDAHRVHRDRADDAETPAGNYRTKGLFADMRIATAKGWRPAGAIAVGEQVLTFDNGMQPLVAATRVSVVAGRFMPEAALPVEVPPGALGNQVELTLPAEQSVMIESDAAETMFGDPFAVLRARDLVGLRGIARALAPEICEVVTLHFPGDEVLYAGGGALVVAPCDVPGETSLAFLSAGRAPSRYERYEGAAARHLVAAMAKEDMHPSGGGAARFAA